MRESFLIRISVKHITHGLMMHIYSMSAEAFNKWFTNVYLAYF